MNAFVSVKSILSNMLSLFGIPQIKIGSRSGKQYLILMYHRILPSRQAISSTQPGMYVDPDTFDMHVRYLQEYFHIVPLKEAFPSVPGNENASRPFCILTFDDGWFDFYEFAYPVLKRNKAPATVFLPTRYIGTNDWFWTDRLERILSRPTLPAQRSEKSGTSPVGLLLESMASIRGGTEERLEKAICLLKNQNDELVQEAIKAMEERVGTHGVPEHRAFLNWGEVREMRTSGFVSFGSHTHSHRILVHLAGEEVQEELALSKKILLQERVVDPSFIPFCYPNGNSNLRIAGMVREAGYHLAVSTGAGWNDREASPFELKRISIHQDMTGSSAMFGCRIAGII